MPSALHDDMQTAKKKEKICGGKKVDIPQPEMGTCVPKCKSGNHNRMTITLPINDMRGCIIDFALINWGPAGDPDRTQHLMSEQSHFMEKIKSLILSTVQQEQPKKTKNKKKTSPTVICCSNASFTEPTVGAA